MRTKMLICALIVVVTSLPAGAGSYAIKTDSGARVVLAAPGMPSDYPSGSVPVPPAIRAGWKNGSLTESVLTVADGVCRRKTEEELKGTVDQYRATVTAEIDAKTTALIEAGVSVTVSAGTYTFSTVTYSQMNIKGKVLKQGETSKVRINKYPGRPFSVLVTSNADLKKIQDAIQDHVDTHEEAGWALKEGAESAGTIAALDVIRAQNAAR